MTYRFGSVSRDWKQRKEKLPCAWKLDREKKLQRHSRVATMAASSIATVTKSHSSSLRHSSYSNSRSDAERKATQQGKARWWWCWSSPREMEELAIFLKAASSPECHCSWQWRRRQQLTIRDGEVGGLQRMQKWRWRRQWRCWEQAVDVWLPRRAKLLAGDSQPKTEQLVRVSFRPNWRCSSRLEEEPIDTVKKNDSDSKEERSWRWKPKEKRKKRERNDELL